MRLIGLIEIEDAFIRKIHITKNKRRRVERLVLNEENCGRKQKTKCNGLYQLSTEYIDGGRRKVVSTNIVDLSKITPSLRLIVSRLAGKQPSSMKSQACKT